MKLNSEEENVLNHFKTFINNDVNVFILTGSAGTGKSTLLTSMFKEVKSRAIAMGPTGRSVKVLHDMGIKGARTIHSSIYEQPSFSKNNDDEEPLNEYIITFSLRNVGTNVDFIFVDEASMVSDNKKNSGYLRFGSGLLLTDLISFSGLNTKLVFVGDNYQLPPIGDDDSHALDAKYMQSNFNLSAETYELKQIQRQKSESGILRNATNLRNCIDTPKEKRNFLEFDYNNDDVYEINSKDITNFDLNSLQNGVIIAYDNKKVIEYNHKIRQKLFGDKLLVNDDRIMPGDKIIFSKNIYRSKLYHQNILNGDTATVIDVSNDQVIHTALNFSLKFRKITFRTSSNDQVETGYIYENFLFEPDSVLKPYENQIFNKKLINKYKSSSNNYSKYQEAMEDYNARAYKYHKLIANWKRYVSDEYPTKSSIERAARKRFRFGKDYKPRLDQYVTNKVIRNHLNNDPFFNAIIAKFGYAVTGHKAQGGEWNTVIVDYSIKNDSSNNSLRWAYTATTRAKQHLYVINPPKFFRLDNFELNKIDYLSKLDSFSYKHVYALTRDINLTMNSMY